MSDNRHLHLEVTLDLGAHTIKGTLHDGTSPTVEFTGYLELMSAFDTMIARATNTTQPAADPRAGTDPTRPTGRQLPGHG